MSCFNPQEQKTIAKALAILEERARHNDVLLSNPELAADYLRLRIGALEHEVFGVLWIDPDNRLIEAEELFRGSLMRASVYPREVVKAALAHNAASCFLYHNHPSSQAIPSRADIELTANLKAALALVDVRVIDHIVVTARDSMTCAKQELLEMLL